MLQNFINGMGWLVRRWEPLLVIVVASVCSVLHMLHKIDEHLVAGATLAVLALIGFSILHDRASRHNLQNSVTKLESTITSLNHKMDNPQAESFFRHETSEKQLLADADEEVRAVQETGSLVLEQYKSEVIELLRKGVRIQLVVTLPKEPTARLLSLRNANLEPGSILQRANLLRAHIKDVTDRTGAKAEYLEIRYIPYPVDMTCIFADPNHHLPSKRKGVVRQAGFKVTYAQKLDFMISAETSPAIFAHYADEARRVFEHASKIILVTGPPRSGKTKLLESILSEESDSPELFFAVSPSLGERNKRLGFAVRFTGNTESISFATRTGGESDYKVDPTVWPQVTTRLREALQKRRVIVLDEIGPIQLKSLEFENFLWSVIEDAEATLFATVAEDDSLHAILRRLKNHHRTTVLRLPANTEEIKPLLLRELRASLRLTRDMYRPLPGEAR